MRVIALDTNNKIIGIRDGKTLGINEFFSDVGEIGQIMQPDGTFVTPETDPVAPTKTVEDRLTNIEDTQDLILLKLEGVIA